MEPVHLHLRESLGWIIRSILLIYKTGLTLECVYISEHEANLAGNNSFCLLLSALTPAPICAHSWTYRLSLSLVRAHFRTS